MNRITDNLNKGTVGELLVQLRLLEHDIQAAPPIKDSGNDLIAIRGEVFRAIQVKTTTGNRLYKNHLPTMYHILAAVELKADENSIYLDQSLIYLIPRDEVDSAPNSFNKLKRFLMTPEHVNYLFPLTKRKNINKSF